MIRDINKEDKDIFIQMVKDFFSSDAVLHDIPASHISKTFKEVTSDSPYAKAYIIEENKQVAGYGLVSLTYSNEAGGMVVWIEELYILNQFRGLGLGNEFIDYIHARFPNAKRFRLELSESNKAAQRLYRRKGFSPLNYVQMVSDKDN